MTFKKLKYVIAMIAHTAIMLALTYIVILQIAGYQELTIKRVIVAIISLLACEGLIGGYKK